MPRVELKVLNPCLVEGNNILQQDDTTHIEVEDIIVGCIRTFDDNGKQSLVNHIKVIQLLKQLDEFTVKAIMACIRCSKAQASRYMAVLALAEPFLDRWVSRGARVRGYVEITPEAVLSGIRLSRKFIHPSEFKKIRD